MNSKVDDEPDSTTQKFSTRYGIKLLIKQSEIHNWGVYADQYIKQGTRIIEYTGEKITRAEEDRREEKNDQDGATYIFQLNDKFSLDGSVSGNESHYINHSCDPNCEYKIMRGHIYIYSKKNIPPGVELNYDYEFEPTDSDPVICNCGSSICRGTINLKE